jgi:hypothetical protein
VGSEELVVVVFFGMLVEPIVMDLLGRFELSMQGTCGPQKTQSEI